MEIVADALLQLMLTVGINGTAKELIVNAINSMKAVTGAKRKPKNREMQEINVGMVLEPKEILSLEHAGPQNLLLPIMLPMLLVTKHK